MYVRFLCPNKLNYFSFSFIARLSHLLLDLNIAEVNKIEKKSCFEKKVCVCGGVYLFNNKIIKAYQKANIQMRKSSTKWMTKRSQMPTVQNIQIFFSKNQLMPDCGFLLSSETGLQRWCVQPSNLHHHYSLSSVFCTITKRRTFWRFALKVGSRADFKR